MQDPVSSPVTANKLLRKLTLHSPSTSTSFEATSTPSPSTPTAARRSLRLSTVSPRDTVTGSPSPRGSFDASAVGLEAGTPSPSTSRFGSTGRRGSGPPGGHSRRMSSISYSTSSLESFESGSGAGAGSGAGPSTPRASTPTHLLHSRKSIDSERDGTLREVEEKDEDGEGQWEMGAGSSRQNGSSLGPAATNVESGAQDLLSFIAKKERKVLELRIELNRHEEELTALKKKWQKLVSKTLGPTTGSLPPPISPNPSPLATFRSSPLTAFNSISLPSSSLPNSKRSPNVPTPLTLAPITPFESISLFDPLPIPISTRSLTGSPSQTTVEMELVGESVQAAKAWMGGVFGKVLEAVGNLEGSTEGLNLGGKLNSLREEDEDEDDDGAGQKGGVPSSSSKDSISTRPDQFWKGNRDSVDSSGSISLFATGGGEGSTSTTLSPSSSRSDLASHRLSSQSGFSPSPSSSNTFNKTLPAPPPSTTSGGAHNRRRSTFEGAWKGLSKRWETVATTVSTSETFKVAKSVAINGVDSFERRLTDVLVGPEPVGNDTEGGDENREEGRRTPKQRSPRRSPKLGGDSFDLLEDQEAEGHSPSMGESLALPLSPAISRKPKRVDSLIGGGGAKKKADGDWDEW